MSKREPKEKTVSFRLDNSWASVLERLSSSQNKKKSDIFREALILYYFITNDTDPQIFNSIFNQNVLKFLFENHPSDKMDELAQIAYDSGVKTYFNLMPNVKDLGINFETSPENMIKILSEHVFPPNKNHWFETVSYEIEPKTIHFHGKHFLGKNFFEFIKALLVRYFSDYDYSLVSETHEEIKQIHKEISKERSSQLIYSVSLTFSQNEVSG